MKKEVRQALTAIAISTKRAQAALARIGISVTHSQALEVIAGIEGHANWHVYRASLAGAPSALKKKTAVKKSTSMLRLYAIQILMSGETLAAEQVLALTLDAAKEYMHDKYWDSRLDGSGASLGYRIDVLAAPQPLTRRLVLDWLEVEGEGSDAMDDFLQDSENFDQETWIRKIVEIRAKLRMNTWPFDNSN